MTVIFFREIQRRLSSGDGIAREELWKSKKKQAIKSLTKHVGEIENETSGGLGRRAPARGIVSKTHRHMTSAPVCERHHMPEGSWTRQKEKKEARKEERCSPYFMKAKTVERLHTTGKGF